MRGQLLAALQARANVRGLVLAEDKALLQELQTSREELDRALGQLEREQVVEILAPLPFLVLRLRKWSGRHEKAGNPALSAYSYSKPLQTKQLKDSYRPVSALSETQSEKNLLREILETLGETDAASFEKAVQLYSPRVIREALSRVRRARGIRKSRTALFRHLLPRLARGSTHIN